MRTPHSISKPATPRGGPGRTPDSALKITDIRGNSAQHRCVERTGGTVGCGGIGAAQRLRGNAVVTVMQTADFWNGDNATGSRRCDRARAGCLLVERKMCSRPHVVGDVVSEDPVQPRRVHHDHVIEALASDRTDDPFHVGVLPW
jgi:hypothetical protein